MSPPLYQRLVETLMTEYGYDYDATPGVIEKFDLMFDPGNIANVPNGPFNEDFATGGRVGLDEGGMGSGIDDDDDDDDVVDDDVVDDDTNDTLSYEDRLTALDTAQEKLGADSVKIDQKAPSLEALIRQYGPTLSNALELPIDTSQFASGELGEAGGFAGQNVLQQQALKMAAQQAGFDPSNLKFDASGKLIGGSLGQQGLGGYQQYLQGQPGQGLGSAGAGAEDYLRGAGQAAFKGQGAGQTGINQAQNLSNQQGLAALSGQNVGAQALNNAQAQANLMSGASLAGQGAGDADFAAARGLTGPQSYQQFMSPYQQEVIDSTMSQYQSELDRQQSELGLSAGNAFGGSRFGVAQGTLGAKGAKGMASQLAQLRQAGFTQANQLANQAYGQRMGLGQAAQQQAGANVGLFGQGLQGQQAMAQGLQGQVGQNVGLLGQAGQSQLAGAQAAQGQAGQNMALYNQAGQGLTGLAQLQPQLAQQQLGLLGQMGSQQQVQTQAQLDSQANAARLSAYEPYDRYGFFGSQLTGLMGGYPGGTTFTSQQNQDSSGGMMGILGSLVGAGAQAYSAFTGGNSSPSNYNIYTGNNSGGG